MRFVRHEVCNAVFRILAGKANRGIEIIRFVVPDTDIEIQPSRRQVTAACPACREMEYRTELVEAQFIDVVPAVGAEIAGLVEVVGIVDRNTEVRLPEKAEAGRIAGNGAEVATERRLCVT